MKIVLSGAGHASSLGLGHHSLVEPHWPEPREEKVTTKNGEVLVPVYPCASIDLLGKVSDAVERRMSRLSKMMYYSVTEAWGQARIEENFESEKTGLIVGTGFGNIEFAGLYQKNTLLYGAMGVSPNLFTASLPSSLTSFLSLSYQIQGPSSTVTMARHTPEVVLRMACDWLRLGQAERVVVVMGDEIFDYALYWAAHFSPPLALGEGAVAFVLENSQTAQNTIGPVDEVNLANAARQDGPFSWLPTAAAFEYFNL